MSELAAGSDRNDASPAFDDRVDVATELTTVESLRLVGRSIALLRGAKAMFTARILSSVAFLMPLVAALLYLGRIRNSHWIVVIINSLICGYILISVLGDALSGSLLPRNPEHPLKTLIELSLFILAMMPYPLAAFAAYRWGGAILEQRRAERDER